MVSDGYRSGPSQIGGYSLVEFLSEMNNPKQADTTMRQNEELFRFFIDSLSDYAIILLGADGRILTWSLGAEQINGFRAGEIVGKDFAVFYRREDIRQGKPQRLLEEAAAKGRVEDEGWRLRKDGSRFWAHVVITALRDREGRLRGFGKIVSDATNRKQTEGTFGTSMKNWTNGSRNEPASSHKPTGNSKTHWANFGPWLLVCSRSGR